MLAVALLSVQPSIAASTTGRSAHARTRAGMKREDITATHAYLVATVAFEEAQLANASRSTASLEATVGRVSGECPGVLAGAPPKEQEPSLTDAAAQTPVSARAAGERNRQSSQREDLKLELAIALEAAQSQPDREATKALVAALAPLRWANPTINVLVKLTVASAKAGLELPVPNVCADMGEWVASGFKTLSPVSKDIASRSGALVKDAFELIAIVAQKHLKSVTDLFGIYENSSDRALALRSQRLTSELNSTALESKTTVTALEATLGLPAPEPLKKLLPSPKRPPVVARGRTAAGGKFVVRAERRLRRPDAIGCSAFITIEEPSRPQEDLFEILGSGIGTGRCVSRSRVDADPAVHCDGGLLTVEADLLPAASSVRLVLSNGHTITSGAIHIPARAGGPAGVYYQVVRGPSPIPTSLIELDTGGQALTTLQLPPVVECTKQPIKYLPRGIVTLARGRLPEGPSFTIRGEGYRKLGALHFELNLSVSNEAGEGLFQTNGGDAFEESIEGPEVNGGVFDPHTQALGTEGLFASQASSRCEPQPYAIVYGLLKAPRDTVLARVSGKLVPLQKVTVPARLHARGVLAYGAFTPLPSELLIRNPAGKTVAARDLGRAVLIATETCEGEAE